MEKIKNYVILGLLALLLISGGLNIYQNKLRKDAEIAAELDRANSNTIIATSRAVAAQKQAVIESIRKDRTSDSLARVMETGVFKRQISTYQEKLKKLPQTVPYQPDSATVDSLRRAFILKDSVITTQALMISGMEVEKEGYFDSFHREIRELELKNDANVTTANELQDQLVEEQGKVRKEVRKKKFFRFLAAVGIVTAGVIAGTSQ